MSSRLTVTFSHVARMMQRLDEIAQNAYMRASDGHYDLALTQQGQTSTSLEDVYESFTKGRRPLDPGLEADLYTAGFCEFEPFGFGTGTWVLRALHGNGHNYALRMSFKTAERRDTTPLIVQPYYRHTQPGLIAEVMPMVQILALEDSSLPRSAQIHALDEAEVFILEEVMYQAMKSARCISDSPCKDIAVLPNGLPIQPDPGQIHYDSNVDTVSALTAFCYAQRTSIFDKLKWLDDKGGWMQDQFFLNPFYHKPHYQGLTLTA